MHFGRWNVEFAFFTKGWHELHHMHRNIIQIWICWWDPYLPISGNIQNILQLVAAGEMRILSLQLIHKKQEILTTTDRSDQGRWRTNFLHNLQNFVSRALIAGVGPKIDMVCDYFIFWDLVSILTFPNRWQSGPGFAFA